MQFAVLNDLHLSELNSTAASAAFEWALKQIARRQLDFVAVAGDFTTYGTAAASKQFKRAIQQLDAAVFFTPGNAEHRDGAALDQFAEQFSLQERWSLFGDLLLVLPDTSSGAVPPAEQEALEALLAQTSCSRIVAITHFPLERQSEASRHWFEGLLQRHPFQLLVAGHTHVHQRSQIHRCSQITLRGLDPDKAIGDLPGISFFSDEQGGNWQEEFVRWEYPVQLQPVSLPDLPNPVGWSVRGNPLEAVEQTLQAGFRNLELRPTELDFPKGQLVDLVGQLRRRGSSFLAYHLPSLKWQEGAITGIETISAHLEIAMEIGADSLTVHVPEAPAAAMAEEGLYRQFLQLYTRLFSAATKRGMRLAVENVHNPPRTSVDDPSRKFATAIAEYTGWLADLKKAMAAAGPGKIGAHFDIGHARNNGGPLDNMQPLGDWYAQLGQQILSYHIHQVGRHPETGKLANHLEVESLFASRISYAGFFWSWSRGQLARAPLFVEIRDMAACRRTTLRFKHLFDAGPSIATSLELAKYFAESP